MGKWRWLLLRANSITCGSNRGITPDIASGRGFEGIGVIVGSGGEV